MRASPSAATATAAAATVVAAPIPFLVTGTLTSAAAATAVTLLADGNVPAGKKVYVTGVNAKVNGATAWATTAEIDIADSNGAPVKFFALDASDLTGNAEVRAGSVGVTAQAAFSLAQGGTAAKGLVVKGDANGTGSDLVVTVWGYIK